MKPYNLKSCHSSTFKELFRYCLRIELKELKREKERKETPYSYENG